MDRLVVIGTEVAAGPLHSIPNRRDRQADDGWLGRAWSHVDAITDDRHIQIAPALGFAGDQLVPPRLCVDQAEDRIVRRAVLGADQRQQFVSNPVSAVVALGVGVVFTPGLADFAKCVSQQLTAKAQQRADQQEVLSEFAMRWNPAKSDWASAAKQVVQGGFDLVVSIVCCDDAAGTARGHRVAQEVVSLVAQGRFIGRGIAVVFG